MKILVAVPYFYDPKYKEFSKTSSGFGYMVKDILDSISSKDDVFVFTHQFSEGYFEKYAVLKHKKQDVIKYLRVQDLKNGIVDAIKIRNNINMALHYLYYQIDKGTFIQAVKENKPDVVHIHGLTYQTRPFIESCLELNQKFIVTLHGLNGLNETVILPHVEKEYEKNALIDLCKRNIAVTVISSGILKKIKKNYGIIGDNIRIIRNGTNFLPQTLLKKDGKKYEIICVGSISFRKNQMQLIDAVKELPVKYRNKLHITFVGVDSDNINLNKYIALAKLDTIAEYKGFIPREEMNKLWRKADLNVVMSKEEGFGLSMIEGFMYGVPTLTFSDLDAIDDLYNEAAFELFKTRKNEDIQNGIISCMKRKFDRKKIIEWGKKFSMDSIGKQYSELYREVLRG